VLPSHVLAPRCFRCVPFHSRQRERAGIHRLLRFPQMFFWVPLRCQRAIQEICGSSPKAAIISHSARGALAPGGSKESEPGGSEALRAPPVPSSESDGPGGAGEPEPSHSGAVLRRFRGEPLFSERPMAALAMFACRPAPYKRARSARQAVPVFRTNRCEQLTDLGTWNVRFGQGSLGAGEAPT
jgi:hypothetical protein